ncbi:MFS transporter [Truepera radiovictrix]|uniref:Major facilitator superfamily MFS_1 n=1 Tax=Truepera radiovictrix (strain DSM 17093 / CIP 108686 / LMG 22925 / RQ-24) TaxID=649638 RepID=D7CT76_TRURR|nr:MFS transporter [Truepera radiovictrix]ADI15539.1 major facilitator superfamily MFS_1 [Truepera radiovictrix DSM 17093]WMT55910.1 MFS transporter [Truepera radiovictrix]
MPRRPLLFTVFAIAYFLSYFFRSTNAVIAEDLTRDLGLSASQLGLMTSLFFLTFAAAQLPLGRALDRFGPRFVTPALMLAAVVGSALFAAAEAFALLALGRALIGLGMAGVLMGALKAFSAWFSPARFATVSGVFLAIGSSGALGAATPLAWLNAAVGWRAVFWGGAVVTLFSALLIALFSRNAPPHAAAPPSQGPAAGGFRDIFRDPVFWRLAALSFAMIGSMFAYQGLWAGPFLAALGLPSTQVGNLLLLLSGGVVLGYFTVGWLADRFGLVRVAAASALLFTLTQFGMAAYQPTWPLWPLGGLFLVFGVTGASSVLHYAHARQSFPAHLTGRAVTAVNVFAIGGGALLQWGLGGIVGGFASGRGDAPLEAFVAALFVTGALCLGATLFYTALAWRQSPAMTPR